MKYITFFAPESVEVPIKFKRNIEKLSLKQLREDIETIITTVRSKLKMLDSERLFVNVIAVENIFYTYPINDMVSLLSLHLITCKTSKKYNIYKSFNQYRAAKRYFHREFYILSQSNIHWKLFGCLWDKTLYGTRGTVYCIKARRK
ncbi:MAG: hypothetical protein J7L07_09040 [Candidatus Odinarchaeota archaeon]|nr:hypothetical protein [Candidatus Odinarchaeota archaeon]